VVKNESHWARQGFAEHAARIALHNPGVLLVGAGANLVEPLSFGCLRIVNTGSA